MTLRANAILTFIGFDVAPAQPNAVPAVPVTVTMIFTCADPGPGMSATYTVTLTDAELATATTLALLKTLVLTKLSAQFHPPLSAAIVTQLTGLIGQTVTV